MLSILLALNPLSPFLIQCHLIHRSKCPNLNPCNLNISVLQPYATIAAYFSLNIFEYLRLCPFQCFGAGTGCRLPPWVIVSGLDQPRTNKLPWLGGLLTNLPGALTYLSADHRNSFEVSQPAFRSPPWYSLEAESVAHPKEGLILYPVYPFTF